MDAFINRRLPIEAALRPATALGAGINDAGYAVTRQERVEGKKVTAWRCPMYRTWSSMIRRCYSKKYQEHRPTYIGCTVAPEWLLFSNFSEWMAGQKWEGRHLDKDILVPGNKEYGPDTCVFINRELNSFLNDLGKSRGRWPIGVIRQNNKFRSLCRNPFDGKQEHLGYFLCPIQAHEAWLTRKREHAFTYADMQEDPRIALALRLRFVHQGPERTSRCQD